MSLTEVLLCELGAQNRREVLGHGVHSGFYPCHCTARTTQCTCKPIDYRDHYLRGIVPADGCSIKINYDESG